MPEDQKPWKRSGNFVYQLNEKEYNAWCFNVQGGEFGYINEAIAKQIVDEHVAITALVKVCETAYDAFETLRNTRLPHQSEYCGEIADKLKAAISLTKKDTL